jgi:hypothetical protein
MISLNALICQDLTNIKKERIYINLKNTENNDEIEQLLVKIADEVKEYISSEK